jgi:Domain of unknown function (DUF6265)
MKKLLLGMLFGFAAICHSQMLPTKIEDISWLAGCWERVDPSKGLQINEQWMKPAGGTMFGTGRTVKNGKTIDYEFTRIETRPEGLFFVARPSANKADTDFKIIRSSKFEIVFENPSHDFPQRVMYRREGDDLFARIEGNRGGKLVGIDFPMKRQSCES